MKTLGLGIKISESDPPLYVSQDCWLRGGPSEEPEWWSALRPLLPVGTELAMVWRSAPDFVELRLRVAGGEGKTLIMSNAVSMRLLRERPGVVKDLLANDVEMARRTLARRTP